MKNILSKKLHHNSLTINESRDLFKYILTTSNRQSDILWGTYWGASLMQNPSFDEVVGMIKAIQEIDKNFHPFYEDKIKISTQAKCITGSGKEDFKTFNVSTMSAIILSMLGYKVLKPSSKSVSATCGSLDILESLDIMQISDHVDFFKLDELFLSNNIVAFDFEKLNVEYSKRYSGKFSYFHPLSFIMPALAIPIQVDRLVYGVASKNVNFVKMLLDYYGYKNYFVVSSEIDNLGYVDELYPDKFYISSDSYYSKDAQKLDVKIRLSKVQQNLTIAKCQREFNQILSRKHNIDAISLACINAALMVCSKDLTDIMDCYRLILKRFLNV